MKGSRRIKRMSRNRLKLVTKMNLTSLMDVFTILVFFLLVNSGTADVLDAPNEVELPESDMEVRPRETVVIYVSAEEIVVQGQAVARVEDVTETSPAVIEPIMARLAQIDESVIGPSTQVVAASREVTILADKAVPFHVVKRVMSSCTSQGYEKVSLAVTQKGAQVAQI